MTTDGNVDREDAGKGLMHADGYTMTKIAVLTKVVLMTIIPKLLLCLLCRGIIIFDIISKTIMTTNGWCSGYRSRKRSYPNFFERFRQVRTYRSNDT